TDFRIASQTVSGGSPVTFAYDNDGLLSRAGAMTITRNAANGLVSGTTLSGITTSQAYTPFGELSSWGATGPTGTLASSPSDRDAAGRVPRWPLTVAGATHVRDYGYDASGRLETVREDGALVEQYAFDANGNRTGFTGATPSDTATGSYDAQDRLLRYGIQSFGY